MKKFRASAMLYSKNNYNCLFQLKETCFKLNINLIAECDFYSLVKKIVNVTPNFIFIDGETVDLTQFPYELLDSKVVKEKTRFVFISDGFEVGDKNVDVVSLCNIESFLEKTQFDINAFTKRQRDYSDKINELLLRMGISSKHKGKTYLTECINLILNNRVVYSCLHKDCYPTLALSNNTKAANIERDIRNAIIKGYQDDSDNFWDELFKQKLLKAPSNKRFIYFCVDKIQESNNI